MLYTFLMLFAEHIGGAVLMFPLVWLLTGSKNEKKVKLSGKWWIFGITATALGSAIIRFGSVLYIGGPQSLSPTGGALVLFFAVIPAIISAMILTYFISAGIAVRSRSLSNATSYRQDESGAKSSYSNQAPGQAGVDNAVDGLGSFKGSEAELSQSDLESKPDNSRPESDEDYYLAAFEELKSDKIQKSLWVKCLTLENGDKEKAKFRYIKHRVAQLKVGSSQAEVSVAAQPASSAGSQLTNREAGGFLTDEDIEYLGTAIRDSTYLKKYRVSQKYLSKGIRLKKIRALNRGNVIWVEDRKFNLQ